MAEILRIIAGIAGGQKLRTVEGTNTRPTADRVKESIFNILSPWVAGSDILDLFAGTGNLGIEALSREAHSAVFVDKDRGSISVIRDNLNHTGFASSSEVLAMEAAAAINMLKAENRRFDLIFMDPPYGRELVPQTLELLSPTGILRENGIIAAEYDKKDKIPEQAGPFVLYRNRKYGDTMVSFYKISS